MFKLRSDVKAGVIVGVFYVIALNINFVMSAFTRRMDQDGTGLDGTGQTNNKGRLL